MQAPRSGQQPTAGLTADASGHEDEAKARLLTEQKRMVEYFMQQQQAQSTGGSVAAAQPPASAPAAAKPGTGKRKRAGASRVATPATICVSQLPDDADVYEVEQWARRVGVVRLDPSTGLPRVRLLLDSQGRSTGQALVQFLAAPSVQLALDLLDGAQFRPGREVRVVAADAWSDEDTRASSTRRIDGDKASGKRRRVFDQRGQLSWDEDEERKALPRHVVLKNMFDGAAHARGSSFYTELHDELLQECSRFGQVGRVRVFERSPFGAVMVRFDDGEAAQVCVRTMDGRWFDQRAISASFWDGKAKYEVPREPDEEDVQRAEQFGDWLEAEGSDEEASKQVRAVPDGGATGGDATDRGATHLGATSGGATDGGVTDGGAPEGTATSRNRLSATT